MVLVDTNRNLQNAQNDWRTANKIKYTVKKVN